MVAIALAGMFAILRGVGDIDGLLAIIRGPLPELLMLLVVQLAGSMPLTNPELVTGSLQFQLTVTLLLFQPEGAAAGDWVGLATGAAVSLE